MAIPNFPIRDDWHIDQGSRFEWYYALATDSGYYDTTGFTARAHIRTSKDAATITLALTTANGRLTTGYALGGHTGGVLVSIPATDTAGLPGNSILVYDLEIIPPSGDADAEKLAKGYVYVDGEVTR